MLLAEARVHDMCTGEPTTKATRVGGSLGLKNLFTGKRLEELVPGPTSQLTLSLWAIFSLQTPHLFEFKSVQRFFAFHRRQFKATREHIKHRLQIPAAMIY